LVLESLSWKPEKELIACFYETLGLDLDPDSVTHHVTKLCGTANCKRQSYMGQLNIKWQIYMGKQIVKGKAIWASKI
jgi:hypothetical protein